MSEYSEKILDEFCDSCGGRLKRVPVSKNGETIEAEKTCPNHYRESEKFEDCKEVVEVVE